MPCKLWLIRNKLIKLVANAQSLGLDFFVHFYFNSQITFLTVHEDGDWRMGRFLEVGRMSELCLWEDSISCQRKSLLRCGFAISFHNFIERNLRSNYLWNFLLNSVWTAPTLLLLSVTSNPFLFIFILLLKMVKFT